jgi:hypothetical protein
VLTGILFFLEMLMEPRASGMLGKCSTVSHAPSPTTFFFLIHVITPKAGGQPLRA